MTTDVLPIISVPGATAAPAAPQIAASHAGETVQVPVASPPVQAASSASSHAPQQTVQQTLAVVAQQIESYLRSIGRSLEFRVDEATGDTIVSVRDSETGELIRQIPSEETIRLARALGNQPNVLVDLLA